MSKVVKDAPCTWKGWSDTPCAGPAIVRMQVNGGEWMYVCSAHVDKTEWVLAPAGRVDKEAL